MSLTAASVIKSGATDLWKWFIGAPVYILSTIAVALLLQWMVRRAISRGIRRAAAAQPRERLGAIKRAARTTELTDILMGERREQRAEAIGQLLKSASQIAIWGTAALISEKRSGSGAVSSTAMMAPVQRRPISSIASW